MTSDSPVPDRPPTAPRAARRGARAGAALVRGLAATGGAIARWSPVWGAVVLFGQVSLLGMRPALEERAVLDTHEARLEERRAELAAELARVEARLRAQDDPVYRERVRRLLLDPDTGR
jgi:hypothetical protein